MSSTSQFEAFKQHFDDLQDCIIRENNKIVGIDLEQSYNRLQDFIGFLSLMEGLSTIKLYTEMRDSQNMTGEEMIQFIGDIQDFTKEINKIMESLGAKII